MKHPLVLLVIVVPLAIAAFFITNNLMSGTSPFSRSTPQTDSEFIDQTYQAALNHCETNYGTNPTLEEQSAYQECINSVENWYDEISESEQ